MITKLKIFEKYEDKQYCKGLLTKDYCLMAMQEYAEEYHKIELLKLNKSDLKEEIVDDLIDKIIKMYVPDGNPEIWLNEIQKLRSTKSE